MIDIHPTFVHFAYVQYLFSNYIGKLHTTTNMFPVDKLYLD